MVASIGCQYWSEARANSAAERLTAAGANIQLGEFGYSISWLYDTNFNSLDIHEEDIRILEPVGLELTNTNISNLSAIADLTSLKVLYLSDTNISDISALENLTSLLDLFVNNTSSSDISVLENLTSLQNLGLSKTKVSDVSALANLRSLERLYLSSTRIADLSPLENLTALQELDLKDTDLSRQQVNVLRNKLPNVSISF